MKTGCNGIEALVMCLVVGNIFSMDQQLSDKPVVSQMICLFTGTKGKRAIDMVHPDTARGFSYYPKESSFCWHPKLFSLKEEGTCFCSVNEQDEEGNTPLHRSIEQKDCRQTTQLLKRGANTEIKNRAGKRPFDIFEDPSYEDLAMKERFADFLGKMSTIRLEQSERKARELRLNRPFYHPQSFHILVTADTISNELLVTDNSRYYAVNAGDDSGNTPLHYLIAREDATIEQIEALLKRGADLEKRNNIKIRPGRAPKWGDSAYTNAIKDKGGSPSRRPMGKFFDDQCSGNKKVMQYVFHRMVSDKLDKIIADQAKREKEEALLKKQAAEEEALKIKQLGWNNVPFFIK